MDKARWQTARGVKGRSGAGGPFTRRHLGVPVLPRWPVIQQDVGHQCLRWLCWSFTEHLQYKSSGSKHAPLLVFAFRTRDPPTGQRADALPRLWVLLAFALWPLTEPSLTILSSSVGAGATGSLPVSVPPPLPLLLGLSWWLWVVIGVGCLVVAVLMGFVICLWKRIQRKKVSRQSSHKGSEKNK